MPHHFYPEYDNRVEEAEPLGDLLAGLSLLQRPWDNSSKHFLILEQRFKNPPNSPYILIQHFYNRTGEFASVDMVRITPELAKELTCYTEGYPYMGGRDETIRSLRKRSDDVSDLFERKARELSQHLKPGTAPSSHGWSSCYDYVGTTNWPVRAVGMGSVDDVVDILGGFVFRNPLREAWVVRCDGTVMSRKEFNVQYKDELKRLFQELR